MKTKKIIFILVLCLAILVLPNIAKAASTVTLTDITVTSAAGTYKTGDEITIEANFSGELASDSLIPSLKLKFGTSELYGSVFITEGTISTNKITYKYTIKEDDSGDLSLVNYNGAPKDKDGNLIEIEAPTSLAGNKISANPITWTDASNVQYVENSEGINSYSLSVNGITKDSRSKYYYIIKNNEEEPTIETDENGRIQNVNEFFFNIIPLENYLELSGDLHFWLYEEKMNYATGIREHKTIVAGDKLERPAQRKLGSRITAYFFNDYTSTYLWEPCEDKNVRNAKVKIGRIEDTSILLAIKNGEEDCLERLLTYAKSNDSIYEGILPFGESATITDKFDVIDDAYYYVYFELEDENGKYYPVEDVSLYQGLVSDSVGKNLFDYLDDNFVWNLEDNPTDGKDDTTVPDGKLPQTGENVIILSVVGALTVVMIGAFIGIRKYRNI